MQAAAGDSGAPTSEAGPAGEPGSSAIERTRRSYEVNNGTYMKSRKGFYKFEIVFLFFMQLQFEVFDFFFLLLI